MDEASPVHLGNSWHRHRLSDDEPMCHVSELSSSGGGGNIS